MNSLASELICCFFSGTLLHLAPRNKGVGPVFQEVLYQFGVEPHVLVQRDLDRLLERLPTAISQFVLLFWLDEDRVSYGHFEPFLSMLQIVSLSQCVYKNSFDHLVHNESLHDFRYLALFRRLTSASWQSSCSGIRFDLWNRYTNRFIHGLLDHPNEAFKLTAPPGCPWQIELPLNLVIL